MFKELTKYKNQNSFTFNIENELSEVCNAPQEGNGIYLVYDVSGDEKELVFVGSTGTIQNNGEIKLRVGGIYDRLVNGQQFGKLSRRKAWPIQMKKENIENLEIHWYETFNKKTKHIPTYVEGLILQLFLDKNGVLPRWNVAF
jgi:hypothetical protein